MARIPFYRQLEARDCGIACLRMALEFLGRHVHYKDVYDGVQTRPEGVTAAALIRAAESFGLRAAAVRATEETLPSIPRGAILHCRAGHYVVLDRVERDGTVRVLDPKRGRRTIPEADCKLLLSGIALVFRNANDPLSQAAARWSAVQAAAKREWSRYRHVLPGAFLWTAVHVGSLGVAAALIGILGGRLEPPIVPLLIGCAALVLCEAPRTISIRRQCANVRLQSIRDELSVLLHKVDTDTGEQLGVENASHINRTLISNAEIAERSINLGHQAACACLALVVLLFVNPVLWLSTVVLGAAFATHAASAALQRVDIDAEVPALEANNARAVAELLRTLSSTSKTASGDREAEQRRTTAACFERAFSRFDRWGRQSDAMNRLWMLTTAIAAVWSIRSDVQSEDPWALAAAFFALLLSVSSILSAQRVISASVRLIALENELEYHEATIYVLSHKASRLKSVG